MFEIRNLSNGIRVVSEKISYIKSVSIGVWVGNGSRHEELSECGISHYIEHMMFKGTDKRAAWQIAREIDSIGGQINAFTAREYTCYYTRTLDTHAPIAIDVLSDMIFNPKLDEADMDLERQVIFEEINMYEDDPDELVHDLIVEAAFGDNALGRSILGTKESISAINADIMREYIRTHYTAGDIVIAVSGNYADEIFGILERQFTQKPLLETRLPIKNSPYIPSKIVRTKEVEQVQLVLGFNGIDTLDENVYSLMTFNNIFGSGMSSRLFQNIREKMGLVYSIYAYHSSYLGAGMFNISAGMSPENLPRVAEMISNEIKTIRRDKLTEDEVYLAKEQLKGNYILSYESTGARMQSAGRSLLMNKPIYSPEEVIEKINAVNVQSVADIIDRVLMPETLCVAAVGAVNNLANIPLA